MARKRKEAEQPSVTEMENAAPETAAAEAEAPQAAGENKGSRPVAYVNNVHKNMIHEFHPKGADGQPDESKTAYRVGITLPDNKIGHIYVNSDKQFTSFKNQPDTLTNIKLYADNPVKVQMPKEGGSKGFDVKEMSVAELNEQHQAAVKERQAAVDAAKEKGEAQAEAAVPEMEGPQAGE